MGVPIEVGRSAAFSYPISEPLGIDALTVVMETEQNGSACQLHRLERSLLPEIPVWDGVPFLPA